MLTFFLSARDLEDEVDGREAPEDEAEVLFQPRAFRPAAVLALAFQPAANASMTSASSSSLPRPPSSSTSSSSSSSKPAHSPAASSPSCSSMPSSSKSSSSSSTRPPSLARWTAFLLPVEIRGLNCPLAERGRKVELEVPEVDAEDEE